MGNPAALLAIRQPRHRFRRERIRLAAGAAALECRNQVSAVIIKRGRGARTISGCHYRRLKLIGWDVGVGALLGIGVILALIIALIAVWISGGDNKPPSPPQG
jgi:hypothetical protein